MDGVRRPAIAFYSYAEDGQQRVLDVERSVVLTGVVVDFGSFGVKSSGRFRKSHSYRVKGGRSPDANYDCISQTTLNLLVC
jgi:hypothetical protein